MNEGITTKLMQLSSRLEELDGLLSSEDVTSDLNNYRKLTREHAEIVQVVELYRAYQLGECDIQAAQEMIADAEMREFAEDEIRSGKEKLIQIELELQKLLLPKDPNDEHNLFLEIRAGTGGDESALFAGDLFRMYTRFAEREHWQVEIISQSLSEVGGYKEIIAQISGDGAYSKLKFESGGHRVQRVPTTETQGRIHTSACTVAIMPEIDEISDVVLNPSELRIDTYRASGAGGQHINKTDSAVRITHNPTGIVVECQDGRSQHKNKASALKVLRSRLLASEQEKLAKERAAARRDMVSTGDRSAKIRTYNFPQGRITDHRINFTAYNLEGVMDGDIINIIENLKLADQQAQLAAVGE